MNKKQFFMKKSTARSADPNGGRLRAISDCFPCFDFFDLVKLIDLSTGAAEDR